MTKAPFRARSRILSLLGDQLIGKDSLAVFELVKNSYDADASFVEVSINQINSGDPTITVIDDGEGMDYPTITDHWLELGNNHKEIQRAKGERTKKFHRLPLGEKGLGRIACHKLATEIELVTRRAGNNEYSVSLDWNDLLKNKYLEDAQIEINERKTPDVFQGKKHGTVLTLSNLRKKEWSRGEVRNLQRAITSICSPFEEVGDFQALLKVPDDPGLLEDFPSIREILQDAPWHFKFSLTAQEFSWSYEFIAPSTLKKKLSGRKEQSTKGDKLWLPRTARGASVVHLPEHLNGIGPISGEFYAWDGDAPVLKLYPQVQALRSFLREQAGIRVYRDGVRVFNYGEKNDDWLNLDLRRVQRPTAKLSRNIVVGGVHLTLGQGANGSEGLKEKTNREGFDENECFERFRELVINIIDKFEVLRADDKSRLKAVIDGTKEKFEIPVQKPLAELRQKLEINKERDELLPLLDRIETEYEEMKELLLRAGMSGINLAIIVHELQRGIVVLYDLIREKKNQAVLVKQAGELVHTIETIAGLLRQKGRKRTDARELVQTAAQEILERRFARHQIKVEYNIPKLVPPFVINGPFDLMLGALTNLIDNAIYWLRIKYPTSTSREKSDRRIFIGFSEDILDGRALVVADNGPGLGIDPDMLAQPFVTRRPGGSGLGLYYASLAAQLSGGSLVFPEKGDLTLPKWVDGAVIALVFSGDKK